MNTMNSHHNLRFVFNELWDRKDPIAPRGGFVDLVFRVVMFHQSIPGIDKFPHMNCLTEQEQLRFCDPEFYLLMQVMMVADSESYTFGNNKVWQKARPEFL